MAVKQQYNIVGRYINEEDARDVVGYHLRSLDGNKQGKYSIEQVAFLVGKEQILNCTVQLYKDKVLFRGKGVSLDSLPTQKIKVDKPNRVGDRATQTKQIQTKQTVGTKENIKLTGINIKEAIKNTIKKYGFGQPNGLKITLGECTEAPYLKIATDLEIDPDTDYRSHYEFIIDCSKQGFYYLRQVDFINDYIIKIDKKLGLEKFLAKALTFIGGARTEYYNKIADLYNEIRVVQGAFEAYSGNSDQITSPLRHLYGTPKETGVDPGVIPAAFVETLVMLMKYETIRSDDVSGIPIFRGDKRNISAIHKGGCSDSFVSFSYCPMTAAEFAHGTNIIYIENAPLNSLVNVEDIAVVQAEYEILVNLGTSIEILEPIGKYSGATIYRAKLNKVKSYRNNLEHLVESYKPYIDKSMTMYTFCKIALQVKHPKQFEFRGFGYEYLIVYNARDKSKYIVLNIKEYEEGLNNECNILIEDRDNKVIRNKDDLLPIIKYLNS